MRYNAYSEFLINKYGEKVYKIPININTTCPNRDGNISFGGCSFCSELGTAFEMLENNMSVKEQLLQNIESIKKKYKANKYIAYFQNFTNTYLPIEVFKKYIDQAVIENVVEISISTRPDCINNQILDYLKDLSVINGINISIELGLQTVNYKTLININRGHTLAEFIDAVLMIRQRNFEICAHVILNLPTDENIDIIETAKIISALKIEFVKLHSLYIAKNTAMAEKYLNNNLEIISVEEYMDRMVSFIRYLDPEIVIQRLFARAPEEETLFCNWDTSWWKLIDMFEREMEINNYKQGDLFNYLNGKALK